MAADTLLARLDRVRRTGPGKWLARCPAHDDRNPSLALRELDGGRILAHCFAGCAVEDVLAAVGLDWDAIMPERAINHHIRRERRPFLAVDVFACALHEIIIAMLIACDLHKNRRVSESEYQRLFVACERLTAISEQAYARR